MPIPLRPTLLQLALAVSALALATPSVVAQAPGTRWAVHGTAVADFQVAIDSIAPHSGRVSIRLSANEQPVGFAGVATKLSAAEFVGRTARIIAWLRTASLQPPGAALWVRVDGDPGHPGLAFESTQGRRLIRGDTPWTAVAVDIQVPVEGRTIMLGALSMGRGQLWVDDVSIRAVGSAGVPDSATALGFDPPDVLAVPLAEAVPLLATSPREPARPLSRIGRENLVAFARLAAYVRFFYPGDSALAVNWDDFTVRGMRVVENAPTADSLATLLRALFAPVAPEVRIVAGRSLPSTPGPEVDTAGVVYWQHCGVGVPVSAGGGSRNIYRSVRHRVAPAGGRIPPTVEIDWCGPRRPSPVPDPARPFVADLGAGVSASVPLALPATGTESDTTWTPRPATERFSTDDRATRLGIVALLWMVPQHFYPYFDVVHTDWTAAMRLALSRAALDGGGAPFDSTLQRLVAALHDGHGNVRRNRTDGYPGVRFGWVEGRVIVTAAGESARTAGISPGDEVARIDGVPAADRLRQAEALVSGATPQWIRAVALQTLARGMPGDPTVLELRGAAPGRRRIVRLAPNVSSPPAEPLPAPVAELRPGIFYVDLGRVTDADVDSAMPRLAAARGVVFDMRGYPGHVDTRAVLAHLSDSTIRSARFQWPLVTRPDHEGMLFAGDGWTVAPRLPRLRARVAFLTGGAAISYAESTMGLVEENRLGAIVGETTAGTNGNVNPFALPGGFVVVWTGMRVVKRDGSPHHGVGIRPTIVVRPTLRGVRDGRDEVLDRALAYVEGATSSR